MNTAVMRMTKPHKGIGMEGMIARWYAKNTAQSLDEFRNLAKRLAVGLNPGDLVLEIAPGPGYLAIELAKLAPFRVSGLDISHSFVEIARANARSAGVDADFRQGDAAALPFAANWFEQIVCRAAFKSFGNPQAALAEMHRVLRPGASVLIIDLRKDASHQAIADAVADMNLGWFTAFMTRATLEWLKRWAYSRADFERMIAASPFGQGEIVEDPMGFEIRLTK